MAGGRGCVVVDLVTAGVVAMDLVAAWAAAGGAWRIGSVRRVRAGILRGCGGRICVLFCCFGFCLC